MEAQIIHFLRKQLVYREEALFKMNVWDEIPVRLKKEVRELKAYIDYLENKKDNHVNRKEQNRF